MSISINDIYWLAGILEGEGYFGLTNDGSSPIIMVSMTDADIIERVRLIVDKTTTISITQDKRKETYKDSYRLTINGKRAAQWMMTLYPLMSIRRKAKIQICITTWKNHYNTSKDTSELSSFSRRLKNNGYSDLQVRLAKGMRKLGLSETDIIAKLKSTLM